MTKKSNALTGPLVVVGPVPPPLNGMTVMTAYVLDALRREKIPYVHLDTSDHREVGNVGRLDLRNAWLALRHLWMMSRLVGRFQPRAVYLPIAQGTLGFLRDSLLFWVARVERVPVVIHLHGASFGVFYRRVGAPMRRLIRRCLGQAVLAIVLGDSLRSVFSGLVETNRIVVLPNGVPPPAGFIAAPEREGTARVLFLSNLSEAKGHLDVIEAAAIVASRLARVRFHLAGEWPGSAVEKAALAAVRARGLAGRVIFHRAVSGLRKWELLHEADVFVFPPRHLEGQPVVILEAMSHGLPVVSTPQGGIVDTVVAGETGLLVPAHDPVALANAIERLLEDEPLRMRMGRAGQARYAAKFTAAAFQSNLAGVMAGSRPEAPLGRVTSGTT